MLSFSDFLLLILKKNRHFMPNYKILLLKEEIKGIGMVNKASTARRHGNTAPNLPSAKPEFENIERAVVGEPKSRAVTLIMMTVTALVL